MKNSINAKMVGYQFGEQCETFGTGISDSFPSLSAPNEFTLMYLKQIMLDNEEVYTIKESSEDQIFYYKYELETYGIECTDDNVQLFISGFLDYIKCHLLEEYLQHWEQANEE